MDEWPGVPHPDAVHEHPYLDPARDRASHRLYELVPGAIVGEDVAHEGDRRLGGIDRSQHGRIRLVAVSQHRDAVAGEEWPPRDLLAEASERREARGDAVRRARPG